METVKNIQAAFDPIQRCQMPPEALGPFDRYNP